MLKTIKGALLAGAASMVLVSTAGAVYDTDVSATELKCMAGVSKAAAKFTGAKAKCSDKCQAGANKLLNPRSDCYPPYGGATATCILDPLKGAESKLAAAIFKACALDCPECYSGGDCTIATGYPTSRTADLESEIDVFGPLVWPSTVDGVGGCDEDTTGDGITAGEAKAEAGTAKALVKFVGCKNKCYDKCVASLEKGTNTGNCLPPSPTDTATAICLFDPIKGCEAKGVAAVDKALVLETPDCYVPSRDSGLEWIPLVEFAVDGNIPETYCGSASGAFLAD